MEGKIYVVTLSTGESFAFSSDSRREAWLKFIYKRSLKMTGVKISYEDFWCGAVLTTIPLIG